MRVFIVPLYIIAICVFKVAGQTPPMLSQQQAQEDLAWLKFSLEYTHPRLYKYDNKTTLDQRFNDVLHSINDSISKLDFLSAVSILNASINCGHLYTIPLGDLREEVLRKKVLPFYLKVSEDDLYIFHHCSDKNVISNGSKLLAINGKPIAEIYDSMLQGIATDGYIETRKRRLIDRYLFNTHNGFDLYYHLHVDRAKEFEVEYQEYGTQNKYTQTVQGIHMQERAEQLLNLHGISHESWFTMPSPRFQAFESQNYAVLTISRSFYEEEVDPDYDVLLASAFEELKEKAITNLIIDVRNNEGGSEHQQMELIAYLSIVRGDLSSDPTEIGYCLA